MNNQKYTVMALFIVIMIDALGWGVAFPVLAPVILNNSEHIFNPNMSLALKNFLYESIIGVYSFAMFIMSPVLGSLSDRLGRKKILILSLVGNFIGFLVSGISIPLKSFTGILLGRCIAGATAGCLPIAQAAMMDISGTKSQKASRLGLVTLANVTGFACGPVIGGFFMDPNIMGEVNYQIPFFISGALALVGVVLLMLWMKETFIGNMSQKINLLTGFNNIYQAFSDKQTRNYCAVFFTVLLGWAVFFSMIPVLLTERFNWHGSMVGYFLTYIALIFAVAILLVLPRITKNFPLTKIVIASLSCLLLSTILFPLTHSVEWLWIWSVLLISVPFSYVGILTLLSMQVDSQHQGKIMGVTGSIMAFTWGIGPLVSGLILRNGIDFPYILAGVSILIALSIFVSQKHPAPN